MAQRNRRRCGQGRFDCAGIQPAAKPSRGQIHESQSSVGEVCRDYPEVILALSQTNEEATRWLSHRRPNIRFVTQGRMPEAQKKLPINFRFCGRSDLLWERAKARSRFAYRFALG